MMRRITAALLALIILLSAVPVNQASAEERIYNKGEVVRKNVGNGAVPNETPGSEYLTAKGYMWELQRDANGAPKMECTLTQHPSCDRLLCFDDDGNRTPACPGVHNHNKPNTCSLGYVWKVVRDPNYVLWYDDPLAPENYELAVCCYEPDGIVPMAGVGLRLFRMIEKEVPKEDGTTEVKMINDSVLPVDPENPNNTNSPVTNKNGYYYFTGECKDSIPAGDETWCLVQMAEEFQAGGKYYNQYRSNNIKWEVDVHVNGDGTYSVNDIRDPNGISLLAEEEEDEYPKPVQGYDAENKRLVILNQPINVIVNIDLINVPASLTQLDATIKGPNGFEVPVQITKSSGRWHYDTRDWEVILESGDYTVEAQTGRYPVVYMVNRSNEEPVEGNTLALDKDHQNGFFEIHFASLSNTVKLYAVDENDRPVSGAVYGLYDAAGEEIAAFNAEGSSTVTIDINGWKELVAEACTLTVKQIQAPENHDLDAETVYKILITETGDELEPYSVELLPMEGEKNVSYGEKNEQIGTFRNRKHDLSYKIIPGAVDQETGEVIAENSGYILTNVEMEDTWDVSSGEILDMKKVMEEKAQKTGEFRMTQKKAPEGYLLSEDSYTVTVTEGENGAVAVEVKKDVNLLKRIAMFFTGDDIARGDFGEWKPVFVNEKEPELEIPHNNTVILRAEDGNGKALKGAKYALFKDGADLGVVFDASDKEQLVIDSDGWMNVAMQLYMGDISEEDKNALMSGGSLEVILKQTVKPTDHEPAAEEYPIEVRRAKPEDNIEDQFFVKVKDSDNGKAVQYESDGKQIATFVNQEMKEEVSYLSLTLEDVDIQWNDCGVDPQLENAAYEMGLYWNADDEPVETITLKSGETGQFRSKIPLGQGYTVKPVAQAPMYNITFTNVTAGESSTGGYTGQSQVTETIALSADIFYDFVRGSDNIDVKLIKCDGKDTGITLEGAKFVLKDASGKEMPGYTYVTAADGKISITGLEKVAAAYTLEETEAPEGYERMKGVVPIVVKYNYKSGLDLAGGETVAIQNLIVEAPSHITNSKKNESSGMAKIQLTLDKEQMKNANACEKDSDGFSQFKNREYTFKLSWKDENGKWASEDDTVTLKSGTSTKTRTFKKELPVGTEYKITSADPDPDYNIVFNGKVESEYKDHVTRAGTIEITASVEYVFEPGSYDRPDLYMKKVYARDTSKTLAGAKFTLKDEDADVLETYKTGKDGIIEIIGLEDYPAEYTLKENKAPDDYVKLDTVIHISVFYDYTPYEENGKVVIRQDLVAEAYHKDVTMGKDGYYYIKNAHKDDNPKTGDGFNAVAWMSALLISAAGLSYVLVSEGKKRRAR